MNRLNLREIILQLRKAGPKSLSILEKISEYVKEKVFGKMEKTINLVATVEEVPKLLDTFEEMLTQAGCPAPVIMQILLSVEEIYVNVANYAYGKETGECRLDVNIEDHQFTVDISDGGIPFDPMSKEDPDITLKLMDRPIGGLGILITKKMMDETWYEYKDNRNHMHLVKHW